MSSVALILALLAVVVALAALARRIGVPYPILLVLGGLALSLLPGLPRLTVAPDVVFLVFLPPLVFSAGYLTSLRDFRANLRTIGVLAVGLVLVTIVGVAVVAHALIPGLQWSAAYVLGAVISPTDPVSATAFARRLGVSRRVVTVLEGESVVNDATGLTASRVAVAAVAAGVFSPRAAALTFVAMIVVGAVVGFVIGWLGGRLLRLSGDQLTTIAITLITPYAAYLSADALGLSGILGAAAAGLTVRQSMSRHATPRARVGARGVWDVLVFLLNGMLFILTGLALPVVWPSLASTAHAAPLTLLGYGAAVSATVMGIRLTVVPLGTLLAESFRQLTARARHAAIWPETVIVGWAGMRGALSLAAALALPVTTQAGAPFPARGLILYLTFAVILTTLVLQGGTLPLLLRRLGPSGRGVAESEERNARLVAANAAEARLEELRGQAPDPLIDRVRESYHARAQRLGEGSATGECAVDEATMYGWLRREALAAERDATIALGDAGAIGEDVVQALEYELDVEALRLAAAYPEVAGPMGSGRGARKATTTTAADD
jgi:Na+/H+ antiporter